MAKINPCQCGSIWVVALKAQPDPTVGRPNGVWRMACVSCKTQGPVAATRTEAETAWNSSGKGRK